MSAVSPFCTGSELHVHFIAVSMLHVCQYNSAHIRYLTLLSVCTITILPLTTVYFVIEVHCISNVLHSNTP